jgi:hypothetical protein
MNKKLKVNEKNCAFINSLPKIYLVALWARYGVREYPFTGKFEIDEDSKLPIPLVYDYDDHNGTHEEYVLRPITWVTTGHIVTWEYSKNVAEFLAESYNNKEI